MGKLFKWVVLFSILMLSEFALAQAPSVDSTLPPQNEGHVRRNMTIKIFFDSAVDTTTINSSTVFIYGRQSGYHAGTFKYVIDTNYFSFKPIDSFAIGEVVTVVLTTGIESSGSTPLVDPLVFSFTAAVNNNGADFSTYTSHELDDGNQEPTSITSADFDNDTYFDLATGNFGTIILTTGTIALNDGDSTFSEDSTYNVGSRVSSVFSADFDVDGDMDLAYTCQFSDSVAIFDNLGDGTFDFDSYYHVGNSPKSIFGEDFDGDGDIDLATANNVGNNITVLLNGGGGSFGNLTNYSSGYACRSIYAADFDNDYDLDLAIANDTVGTVVVLWNDGSGSFNNSTTTDDFGQFVYSVYGADFDGDRNVDLVTANWSEQNTAVILNDGNQTFGTPSLYNVISPAWAISSDVDGDADLDIIFGVNAADTSLALIKNNDNSSFMAPEYFATNGPNYFGGTFADLDSDGDLDISLAMREKDTVRVVWNTNTYMCGDANGDKRIHLLDMLYLISYIYDNPPGPAPNPIQAGDENGDESINLLDILYLIAYVYDNPSAPPPKCPGN